MAWTWQMTTGPATSVAATVDLPEDEAGGPEAGGPDAGGAPGLFGAPAGGFSSQADAETWLGTIWRELAADGVSAASLFEDDRLVYGPMSLEPG